MIFEVVVILVVENFDELKNYMLSYFSKILLFGVDFFSNLIVMVEQVCVLFYVNWIELIVLNENLIIVLEVVLVEVFKYLYYVIVYILGFEDSDL